jgi:CheY-like chemotaxis protein
MSKKKLWWNLERVLGFSNSARRAPSGSGTLPRRPFKRRVADHSLQSKRRFGTLAFGQRCIGSSASTCIPDNRIMVWVGEGVLVHMAQDENAAPLLYVEDEVLIQDVLASALIEAGFQVLTVGTGAEALEALQGRAHEFGGLITDINLGSGPDGWEVARRARELISGLPVVYVSAASQHDWTSKGVPQSVMIAKPFAPAQIVVAIAALLNKAPQQDGS